MTTITKALIAGLLVIALIGERTAFAQWNSQPVAVPIGEALAALLQKGAAGYASTDRAWRYTFPRDYGVHPDHRTELWHFSGSVVSRQGRRFGFQVGFFRIGVIPPGAPAGPSAWATRNLYWAQFALDDAASNRFHASERIERAAMDLSGASSSPPRVWVGNWVMEVDSADAPGAVLRLDAAIDEVRIALALRSAKPPVAPAVGGGRSSGSGQPNPFHAYLMTRLVATGTVHIGTERFEVEGRAWLDRAWGLVPLPWGAVVWDRFLVQLDDGRELMALRLRRRDGGGNPVITGMLVAHDGSSRMLDDGAVDIELLERDGTRFPSRWWLRVPGEGIELGLTAYVAERKTRLSMRSWAGAVDVGGTSNGRPIRGNGYVELAANATTAGGT
jgi:predicted secreted hydrolase